MLVVVHARSNSNSNHDVNDDNVSAPGVLLARPAEDVVYIGYIAGPDMGTLRWVRPIFILRILRPRIFESKFRNHRAKKLVGALRKSTFV